MSPRFKICCFCLCIASLFSAEREPYALFLTYPRSGRTWMTYCLKTIIDKGTNENAWIVHPSVHPPYLDPEKKHFFHRHYENRISSFVNPKSDYLLVIVRNPIESLVRHCGSARNAIKQFRSQSHYFRNLQYFDKWKPKRRYLVYYENFIRNPKQELEKILRFLDAFEEESLDAFIEEFAQHKQACLEQYEKNGGSRSRGEDLLFHSKNCSQKELSKLVSLMKKHYPTVWKNYLSVYDDVITESLSINEGS